MGCRISDFFHQQWGPDLEQAQGLGGRGGVGALGCKSYKV